MNETRENCPYCGAPVEPGAQFCTACGQPLNRAAVEGEMPPDPQPEPEPEPTVWAPAEEAPQAPAEETPPPTQPAYTPPPAFTPPPSKAGSTGSNNRNLIILLVVVAVIVILCCLAIACLAVFVPIISSRSFSLFFNPLTAQPILPVL